MSHCPYYQNLCQRDSIDDYAARHYCCGDRSKECRANKDITVNLIKFLASEGNLDFLDDVVNEQALQTA